MDKETWKTVNLLVNELDLAVDTTGGNDTIFAHISNIVALAKEYKLTEEFWSNAADSLAALGQVLTVTPRQALIFSLLVELSDDRRIRLNDVARLLKCNQVDIMRFSDELESLRQRKLLRRRRSGDGDPDAWRVPQMVLQALQHNECYVAKPTTGLTLRALFDVVKKEISYLKQNELSLGEFEAELDELLNANLHLPFCVQFKAMVYRLDAAEKMLLVHVCVLYADFVDKIDTEDYDRWLENDYQFHWMLHTLVIGDNLLLDEGIFECVPDESFGTPTRFRLTDRAKEDLQLNEVEKHRSDMARRTLVAADSITAKQLYFNTSEQEQFDRLWNLLMPDRFHAVCNNLKSNGLRQGFACLFYGSPGTGKTESVYQLARKTGRDIMRVDIAQSKSMWYDESEKRIQAIFDRYRSLVRDCNVAPILLFNEADAILSSRKTIVGQSPIDKTENAMQNILLQEIERLDGILIATTNLTQNLDKAFERRFLYKIEFRRPMADARNIFGCRCFRV